jgi:hypothetical protein
LTTKGLAEGDAEESGGRRRRQVVGIGEQEWCEDPLAMLSARALSALGHGRRLEHMSLLRDVAQLPGGEKGDKGREGAGSVMAKERERERERERGREGERERWADAPPREWPRGGHTWGKAE